MTFEMIGLMMALASEPMPHATPMAKPVFFANQFSSTMATPMDVLKPMQKPMIAPDTYHMKNRRTATWPRRRPP